MPFYPYSVTNSVALRMWLTRSSPERAMRWFR